MIEAAKSKYNILFNPGKENGGRFQPLLNDMALKLSENPQKSFRDIKLHTFNSMGE